MPTPPHGPGAQTAPDENDELLDQQQWQPLTSLERILGRSPHSNRVGSLNNAELVVWQSSRRFVIAVGLGALAVVLRLAGVIAGPVWPILAVVPVYVVVVALFAILVERRHQASRVTLIALSLIDVAAIFVVVGLATAPAYYARALLLSLLALQFTQLFFGRSPALTVVGASFVGYIGLLVAAAVHGMHVAWVEESWLLALFLLAAFNGITLQASANRRLASLVDLFASAQRGDFSRTFVEEGDREPDGITLLGRSYNHLRSEVASMVLSDPLTGCLNRRGFEHVLNQAVHNAGRRGERLALLAVDIDHFKIINDTAGHLAGDAVLRELADVLTRSSRGGDVVARVGGEEFVVLLPGADGEMAGVVAERMLGEVRSHVFRTVRGRQHVTVSVGIACERVVDQHIMASIRARADEALYVAKRLGRNRVVMWAPGIRSNATPPWSTNIATG
ncbi:MAG: diguanylate cyclase [Gemmatimonadales bacterium]